MGELHSVERQITEDMLESGEITVGPAEQDRLGLGNHSTSLDLVTAGETITAVWTAGRRRFSGEALAEFLQDTAQVGGLLRLERRGAGAIEVVIRPPGASLSVRRPGLGFAAPPPARAASGAGNAGVSRVLRRKANSGTRYRLRKRDEYRWHGDIGFLRAAQEHTLRALRSRGWDPADAVQARLDGERLATLDQFDELLAVDAAHIEHMPHQEAAARTVLARMGGRGILADEVGLGKTVEAGLVLKELLLRGLAQRILIVCPAPLRDQWRDELRDKFDEDFTVVASGKDTDLFAQDRIIMTMQLARLNAHRFRRSFDLVIIDEAHRLSGKTAHRTREVFGDLVAKSARALFLSATPVQNDLLELYRLVELLRPGTFDSERDFTDRFVDRTDPRRPVNAVELRKLISSVVVRTTRQQAGVDRVHRMPPQDHPIRLTGPERQLYDMVLGTLRSHMTGPGDTMRRRQLALRLTASPQAVSRSALRMAGNETDPALKRVLAEIGHLAGDIRHTSREQAALGVIQRWLDEHGRVLVFTQHTDTLTGILRLLDTAGIRAAPFHGSMAHSARSASVRQFRAGEAQVLVSTDAGAEGQNLQVSNCVLNYDLPWNPMRVEQRIGRVHRLTQTRDVHIANLFAVNTVDEAVYRLLHDKLAMFELLFGQVVTVLGELEGGQESSMETRVLEALYANSDQNMQHRLDELGRQLEQARDRASSMMTADSGLSEWLAQRQEERLARAQLPEARELLPQIAEGPRRRQSDVERFVCDFLELAGAEVTRPAEAVAVFKLGQELSEAFGDRSELVVAFTSAALDYHPEAQLCVVGSEIFDEILEVLRERGDLTGTVPVIPDVHQGAVLPHHPSIRLLSRRIEPGDGWSARGTYRVQEGASSGNQRLVTVDVGSPGEFTLPRRALTDCEAVPLRMPEKKVLETLERAATDGLRRDLEQAQAAELKRQEDARDALVASLEGQLDAAQEAYYQSRTARSWQLFSERKDQLKRALKTARKAAAQTAGTELRAELLTLELHGADELEVVETWGAPDDQEWEIRYEWTGDLRDFEPRCGVTDRPIETLAICGGGDIVDARQLAGCRVCATDWCAACGPDRAIATCLACGQPACGTCRGGGDLCGPCRRPERAPELDADGELGWRLQGGTALLVGARHAVLVRGSGERQMLVPDGDLDDPVLRRARGLAASLGLSPSAGLRIEPAADPAALTADALWSDVETAVWWKHGPDADSAIDPAVVALLPDLPSPDAAGEAGLGTLLRELRGRGSAQVSGLAAVPLTVVRRVDVEAGQFRFRELWYDATGDPMTAADVIEPLQPSRHQKEPHHRSVAAVRVGPVWVEVDGVHRSYLCHLTDGVTTAVRFLPGVHDATAVAEEQLAAFVAEAGLPPHRVIVREPDRAAAALAFSAPAAGTQVRRKTAALRILVDSRSGVPETGVLPGRPRPAGPEAAAFHDNALRSTLAALDVEPVPVASADAVSVDEQWESRRAVATRAYLAAPGRPLQDALLRGRELRPVDRPLLAVLDDGTEAAEQVSVDSHGHLYDRRTAADCPVCAGSYGPCCGPAGAVGACHGCGRDACGTCREGRTGQPETACARCGDRSCADCSRTLAVIPCDVCARDVCPACVTGRTCGTCQYMAPATEDEIAALPGELAVDGLNVRIAHDRGGSVVLLRGPHRLEVAVLDAAGLVTWTTAARDPHRILRFGASVLCGSGDAEIAAVAVAPVPMPDHALVLDRHTDSRLDWAVLVDGRWRGGTAMPPATAAAAEPDPELVADLAAQVAAAAGPLRMPGPAEPHRLTALRRAAKAVPAPAATTEVVAFRQQVDDAVLLDARGLVARRVFGRALSETVGEWGPPTGDIAWARAGWRPEPEIVALAHLQDWTAAVAAVGRFAMVAVRHGDADPTWHPLGPADGLDLFRASIGEAFLGPGVLATVGAATEPGSLRGPVIVDATPVARRVRYLIAETTSDELPPADAWAMLMRGAAPAAPPAGPALPAGLVGALRRRVDARPRPESRIDVGLQVEEDWTLGSGGSLTVKYDVEAGRNEGYLIDAYERRPIPRAVVCRSLHLVERADECASCRTSTCRACPDAVRPCALCQGPTCAHCVATGDGRCPACAALAKVKLLERRRFDVPVTSGGAWYGESSFVQVTVRRRKESWTIERQDRDGTAEVPLTGPAHGLFQSLFR